VGKNNFSKFSSTLTNTRTNKLWNFGVKQNSLEGRIEIKSRISGMIEEL